MQETSTLLGRLRREVFVKNLMSLPGIAFLIVITAGVSYFVYAEQYILVAGLIAAVAGSIGLYFILFKPLLGYYLVCILASFAFYPEHLFHIELGLPTIVEILSWFLLIGSYINRDSSDINNNILKSPVTLLVFLYVTYFLLQYFNPELHDRSAYFLSARRMLMVLWFFIASYRLINTPGKFRFFMKFWIFMVFLVAVYGCYQQWFGLLPGERSYIMDNPVLYGLAFQGGQIRKFSFLSDVVQFGVFTGAMSIVTTILAINEKRPKKRLLLSFVSLIMILAMTYSGTRTTTFILPLGISLYILMTIRNKTTLVTIFGGLMVVLFVLFAPIYSNKTLNRVRTSFESDDPSLNVRDVNRHYIQPYIYKHPFGGGIGTTGAAGYAKDPTHYLANFPPDSGFLKAAVETGWISLVIMIVWYLTLLYYYIYTAFRIRNQEFKIYAIALACCLLGMVMTQYSQVSIGQMPMIIFFISVNALSKRLLEFQKLNLYKT